MKKIFNVLLLCILVISCKQEVIEHKAIVKDVIYHPVQVTYVYSSHGIGGTTQLYPTLVLNQAYFTLTILYDDSLSTIIETSTLYNVGDTLIYKTYKFK